MSNPEQSQTSAHDDKSSHSVELPPSNADVNANASVTKIKETNQKLTFTLKHVFPSVANAIRRTILSDIPVVGFLTTPFEENKATILKNTSRFNNEYLKQRLSCIPIHSPQLFATKENEITTNEQLVNDYAIELHVQNKTDSILWVTSHDFKLVHKLTKEIVADAGDNVRIIDILFPPFIDTSGNKHYIDIMSLRPLISDSLPGEEINLTCEFSICVAKKNSCYNVSRLVSYENTIDKHLLTKKIQDIKTTANAEKKDKTEIDFMVRNFELLEGKRLFIPNSFDFTLESIGIYSNKSLVEQACTILEDSLNEILNGIVGSDESIAIIQPNLDTTIPNCWDIILQNEDYTLGTILNDKLYRNFCHRDMEHPTQVDTNLLDYCGFKKEHPHDKSSVIRIGFGKSEHNQIEIVQSLFSQIIPQIIVEFVQIRRLIISS